MTVTILSEDDNLMPSVDSENFLWMSTRISAILSFSKPDVHLMRPLPCLQRMQVIIICPLVWIRFIPSDTDGGHPCIPRAGTSGFPASLNTVLAVGCDIGMAPGTAPYDRSVPI